MIRSMAPMVALLLVVNFAPAGAQVAYTDIAASQGIGGVPGSMAEGIGGGVAWLDYDNDGDLDLAVSASALPATLYENIDGMLFADVFALIPDTPPAEGGGVIAFDADSDGDTDVILLRQGRNVFFRNDGGIFVDATEEHLPGLGHWSASAAAGDFDGDGDDDLLIGNYIAGVSFPEHQCARSALLENDGTGRFIDRTLAWGVPGDGCTLGTAMSDYDDDGDLDLFIINDFGHFSIQNQLYRNDGPAADGGWQFTDVSEESGFAYAVYGMGLGINDVDDDGWLDYYATSIGRQVLLSAQSTGNFIDRTADLGAGVTFEYVGYQMTWSAVLEDLDGDGWVDLFATGGHIPAAAFIKNGTDNSNLLLAGGPNGFTLDPPGWSIPEPTPNSARGVSLGDANGDGRLDMAVSHVHGVLSIYETPNSHPIPLRIRPTPSVTGPTATGFRVQCTCGGTTRTRELSSGGHLGSSSPSEIRLTFPGDCGIPGTALDLVVRWPSGYVQTIQTTMGALLELVEPPWITLDANTISLAPNDSSGAPVVSSSQLVISADHASVGPLTPDAGGFSATYIPDGEGPVRFSLAVDGVLLPVHPTWTWVGTEPRTLRTYPEQPILGSGYTISAVPRDVNGTPLPAPLEVEFVVNGVPFPAVGNAGPSFSVQMAPPNTPGTVVIQLQVSGADYGAPIERTITAAIDPQQSRLRMGPLYTTPETALSSTFRAYLVARDVNGQSLDTEGLSYELRVNDQVIAPILMTNEGGEVLLTYPAGSMADGDEVRFFVDGVEFPGPQIFQVVPSDASALPSLDIAQSKCSFAMATLAADGLDVATALFFPRDAFGNPIPGDVLPLSFAGNQGLEVIQDTVNEQEDHWIFSVRAGLQTGFSTVDVLSDGISVDMPCVIETLEPTAVDIGSSATSSIEVIPNKLPAGTESTAKVKAYPRTADGRLIGSAATIELTAEGADLLDVSYRGIGLYRGTLEAAAEPGFATVSLVDGDKVIATATVEMFDPNPAAEPTDDDDLGQADATTIDSDAIAADAEDNVDATVEDAGTGDDATEPSDGISPSDTFPQEDSAVPVDTTIPADTAPVVESDDTGAEPETTDTTGRQPPRTDLSTEGRSNDILGSNRSEPRTEDVLVTPNDGGGCQTHAPSSQPTTLSLWLLTCLFIYYTRRRRHGTRRHRHGPSSE